MPTGEAIEQKAFGIMLKARQVADEMQHLRASMTSHQIAPPQRNRMEEDLEDATARLCNLISLAIAEISLASESILRDRFDTLLEQVRGQFVDYRLKQMAERIRRIHQQALSALTTETYRLGLAARLDRSFKEVRDALTAMGTHDYPGLDDDFLDKVIEQIEALAAIEATAFKLLELDLSGLRSERG